MKNLKTIENGIEYSVILENDIDFGFKNALTSVNMLIESANRYKESIKEYRKQDIRHISKDPLDETKLSLMRITRNAELCEVYYKKLIESKQNLIREEALFKNANTSQPKM